MGFMAKPFGAKADSSTKLAVAGSVFVAFALSFGLAWGVMIGDWTMVSAIAALIAVVISAVIGIWQTRHTLRIQTLIQMMGAWQSPPMFPGARQRSASILWGLSSAYLDTARTPAATSALLRSNEVDLLVESEQTGSINAVLDFFETVAFLVRNDELGFEHAHHAFYWPMACYWVLTREYIRRCQEEEGNETWVDYCRLMPLFFEREGKQPDLGAAREFLRDEYELAP